MISHQRSQASRAVLYLVVSTVLLTSCASRETVEEPVPENPKLVSKDTIQSEYSIKEDRNQFKDLRQQMPEEVRRENDELALVLNLMKEYKESPSEIRRKFDKVLRKKRNAFNKKMKRDREVYNKEERKKRDSFLKYLKKKRENARKLKLTREQNRDFQREYREERDDFFNTAKEKRYEFEGEWKEKSKDFESYVREQRKEFSDELRAYSKGYYDYQKNIRLKKKMNKKEKYLKQRGELPSFQVDNAVMHELREFDIISTKPATTLSTDGE